MYQEKNINIKEMFSSSTSGKDVASLVTSEFSNSVAKTDYKPMKVVVLLNLYNLTV